MSQDANAGTFRVMGTCPECKNREPKEVVGKGKTLRLYCSQCGKDFDLVEEKKKSMGTFTFFFALLALAFAFVIFKRTIANRSRTEVVDFEDGASSQTERVRFEEVAPGDTSEPVGAGWNWENSAHARSQSNKNQSTKAAATPLMSTSERDIREKWGWDSKGTSLNRPAR